MNQPHLSSTRPGHTPSSQYRGAPMDPLVRAYPPGPVAGTPTGPVHGAHRPGPSPDARPWGPPHYPGTVNGYPSPPPAPPVPAWPPMAPHSWQGNSIGGFGTPPPPAEMKPKRRRGRIIATAIVVIAAAAGGAGAWWNFGASGAEEDITAAIRTFKAAVDAGDVAAVTAQMCAEEAAMLDGLELPPSTPLPPANGDDADDAPAAITDIKVKGTVASGTVADAPDAETKVYFRKEGEQWKLCSSAKADFDAAA